MKFASLDSIITSNNVGYLRFLRPEVIRSIMSPYNLSYNASALRLDGYINKQNRTIMGKFAMDTHKPREDMSFKEVRFCAYFITQFEFYEFDRRGFWGQPFYVPHGDYPEGDLSYGYTSVQLPLRYRDRFHKLVLAAMVLSELTK